LRTGRAVAKRQNRRGGARRCLLLEELRDRVGVILSLAVSAEVIVRGGNGGRFVG
jgi:hypothetical protein